jgi:hypothetical protein
MKLHRTWLASVVLLPLLAGCGTSAPSEPEVFVKELSNNLAAGDLGAVWKSLPPKYQADVKGLINEAASNLDAEVYDKGFALAGKVVLVMKSKKDFFLDSKASGSIPMPHDVRVKNWPFVVDALESVANSEIKTHAGLKNVDPQRFLATTGNKLFNFFKAVVPDAGQQLDKLKSATVSTVRVDGDIATLKVEIDGRPPANEVYQKVEGKWLPKEMVDKWDAAMAQVRGSFGALKLTPEMITQVLEVIKVADPVLDRLLAAPDQAAFDKELANMQGAIMGAMLMGGGGPTPAVPAPPK